MKNEIDEKIVTETAKKWIELGGDSVGFFWTSTQIQDKIEELEQRENQT